MSKMGGPSDSSNHQRLRVPTDASLRPAEFCGRHDYGETAGANESMTNDQAFADHIPPQCAASGRAGQETADAKRWWVKLVLALVALGANLVALTEIRLPFIGPAIGLSFILLQPCYLLAASSCWRHSGPVERIGYSLTAVILYFFISGLILNTVLPWLGVTTPLSSIPTIITADLLNLGIYWYWASHGTRVPWRAAMARLRLSEIWQVALAVLCPLLAVMGANRLNNGAGDQISLLAQACVVALVILLLCNARIVAEWVAAAALYGASLAMLWMTSLRGWSITGHDIQTEYRVFQLTAAHSRWNMASFRSPYNACLSISIFPTQISRFVLIDHAYVFKCVFQIIFASCAPIVYTLARRYVSKRIALIAATYFIGFPTFFGEMPFMNRQEIAFLFVATGLLAASNAAWPPYARRGTFLASALGVELSHYSTMYLLAATLLAAWVIGKMISLSRRVFRRTTSATKRLHANRRPILGVGSVAGVCAIVFLWGSLATGTLAGFSSSVTDAASQLYNANNASTYGLLSPKSLSAQQILTNYRDSALAQNANATPGTYLPISVVTRYSTPLVSEPDMHLTSVGRLLAGLGVPVARLNGDIRGAAAKDEQLFLIIGLGVLVFSPRVRRFVGHEETWLCLASVGVMGLFVALPALSIDYGVLRAFQETLIFVAPVIAFGSICIFWLFGERWAMKVATAVAVLFFASTIGLIPQVLGGYQAQLSLNNSGADYDIYYVHTQDEAAVDWLAGQPGVLPDGLDASMGGTTASMFDFNNESTVDGSQSVGGIFPALIGRKSWVLLNWSILHSDRAPLLSNGELIMYSYPIGLLESEKDLVYNNGGAEIYR